MKRLFIMVLISTIIFTGCTKPTSEVKVTDKYEYNLIEEKVISSDEEFVTYINNVEQEVTTITEKEDVTAEDQKVLENTFITLTDFIFYNGEINGVTFDELTDSAKGKVLDIYDKIDTKIESAFPNYKENIASKSQDVYANIKKEIAELRDKIKDKYIDEYGQEKYDNLEQSYNESKETLKDSAQSTYETLKDVSTEFYENTKNKAENWYKNYKESRN